MSRRRSALLTAVIGLAGLATWVVARPAPGPPAPDPPGAFSFAALGDAPYAFAENLRYRLALEDLAAHSLTSVIHVGDILSEPCTNERYERSLDWFNALPHPVIYTPGDNDWTDCWEFGQDPLDRLASIRATFFHRPGESLGGDPIALEHQGADERFGEFVENARWTQHGVMFATLHLVGSRNGLRDFPARTSAHDEEAERRMLAALDWLRETLRAAGADGAAAVVLAFHANPGFDVESDDPLRMTFEPFLAALREEVQRFGAPVLAIHGDWHDYTVDHPLTDGVTGQPLRNLTRLQVPGSPHVGWVRITVATGDPDPFSFEARVIPGWKYW